MSSFLVTGAGGGMGKALCAALLKNGHRVWCIDRPGVSGLPEGLRLLPADIRSSEELQAAFETVKQEAGKLEKELSDPETYRDPETAAEKTRQYHLLKEEINRLYSEWEALESEE